MDVIVDGKRNFEFTAPPEDAFAAVAVISNYLHAQGRAILGVRADGKNIDASNLVDELQGKKLDEVGLLEVNSESVTTLVENSLAQLSEALNELPQACHRLAEVFQGESPADGYEPFQSLAEVWGSVKTRELQVARALDLSLDGLEVNGVSLEQIHTELNSYLEEAAGALESGDCVLLGDLLEYELAPRAETEAAIVDLLKAEAKNHANQE